MECSSGYHYVWKPEYQLLPQERSSYLETVGVDPKLYAQIAQQAAQLQDLRDATGAVAMTKKKQLFQLIESQKLTAEQKEAIWNLLA